MRLIVVAALCVVVLAGCQRAFPDGRVPRADRAFAVEIIRALQTRDYARVTNHMNVRDATDHAPHFAEMTARLPTDLRAVPRLVNATLVPLTETHRTELSYALDGGGQHAVVRIVFIPHKADVFLKSVEASAIPMPIEKMSEGFGLIGKTPARYLFLALGALSSVTILGALYVLYRAKNVVRKWPWALGSMFAIGQCTMDWSTGAISGSIADLRFLGAWIEQPGPVANWEVSLGVPLVAYIFLLRQARVRAAAREVPVAK
jgi:hypothetical protein